MEINEIIDFLNDNYLAILVICAGFVGLTHGIYLGRNSLAKIDKRRKRAKWLVFAFSIIIILAMGSNLSKFTNPSQLAETLEVPSNPEDVLTFIENFIMQSGAFGIVSIIVSVIVFSIGRRSDKKGTIEKFMQITGVGIPISILLVNLGVIVPDENAIMIFSANQMGIIVGAIIFSGFMKQLTK